MYGYIPEEIAIVHSGTTEVSRGWHDLERDKEQEVVTPAFPLDPTNKKKMETANHWAKQRGRRSYNDKESEVFISRRKNEPFNWLRVMTLEVRSQGGRAWKVVDRDGFYFDLREDILLDIMRHCGMEKNAEITGEFIWAVVGNETKVVRVGSGLHDELEKATEIHNTKPITNKQLRPGDICRSKSGTQGLFLGWVDHKQVSISPHYNTGPNNNGMTSYNRTLTSWGFTSKDFKGLGLWWITDSGEKDVKGALTKCLNTDDSDQTDHYYSWGLNFHLKKTHSFRQLFDHIDLPSDVVEQVRQLSLRETQWTEKREKAESVKYARSYYSARTEYSEDFRVAQRIFPENYGQGWGGISSSSLSWMRLTGQPCPHVKQYNDILGEHAIKLL